MEMCLLLSDCRIVILKAKAAVSELQRLDISVSTKYFQTAG